MSVSNQKERFNKIDELNFKLYVFVGIAFVVNGFLFISNQQGMKNTLQVSILIGAMLIIRRFISPNRIRAFFIGCFAVLSGMPAMLFQTGGNLMARHYIILTALCMITLYFDKQLGAAYIVFVNALVIFYFFIVPEQFLINPEYNLGHFMSLLIYLNICNIIFFICIKWGNDLLDSIHNKTQQLESYAVLLEEQVKVKILELESMNSELTQQNKDLEKTLYSLHENQEKVLAFEKANANIHLVTGLAHEFNTPLGVCITAVSYLQNQMNEVEKIAQGQGSKQAFERAVVDMLETVQMIQTSEQRTQNLIEQILVSEQAQKGDNLPFLTLKVLVNDIIAELNNDVCSEVSFKNEVEDDVQVAMIANELRKILTELIANALVHGVKNQTHGCIRVLSKMTETMLQIHVADNGAPIDEDIIRFIYEPFFTTLRDGSHVGLGLNSVYKLTREVLKGDLLYNQNESGKEFVVWIPLHQLTKEVAYESH